MVPASSPAFSPVPGSTERYHSEESSVLVVKKVRFAAPETEVCDELGVEVEDGTTESVGEGVRHMEGGMEVLLGGKDGLKGILKMSTGMDDPLADSISVAAFTGEIPPCIDTVSANTARGLEREQRDEARTATSAESRTCTIPASTDPSPELHYSINTGHHDIFICGICERKGGNCTFGIGKGEEIRCRFCGDGGLRRWRDGRVWAVDGDGGLVTKGG